MLKNKQVEIANKHKKIKKILKGMKLCEATMLLKSLITSIELNSIVSD
jgi:hypothetical protein